ncbi:GNAT family N-acetyltransferase [Pseudomonas sp. LFM046]|uniref:GNAT family N-acetyltransferase n=1 Tax=Pseudomonas sp. LFM046 TaxID=1608357 RepID=UPI0009E2753D|nr:GNAT family N-acetyltransferase [Pseudomonas sp. LFM046]
MSGISVESGSDDLLDDKFCSDIARVYCSVGWGDSYEISLIRELYLNSGFFVVAKNKGECVGVLRALTDNCLTTWIAEVVVDPKYQGLGVGTALMAELKERYKHTAIYTDPLKGAAGFFEKVGVSPREKLVACSRRAEPL